MTVRTAPVHAPEPPRPFLRAGRGRVVAGVCRGLADHLGINVVAVRAGFLLLAVTGAAGLVMYAAFWVFAPLRVEERGDEPGGRRLGQLLTLAASAVGALVLADSLGIGLPGSYLWPLLVIGAGVVLLWWQADDAQRARFRAATGSTRLVGTVRGVLGVALAIAGVVAFVGARPGSYTAGEVLLSVGVGLGGVVLASGPWWVRMARELAAERAARIREQERAEVAAHVHDSVLHTLTLIQRNVDDPRTVTRLARAQERDLRTWLYRPAADPGSTLTAALEGLAADIEDDHGVAVDVVTVGDCDLDEAVGAMLRATREALVNAAKYAGASPISVFAEVEPEQVTVFVRDRGPGFDLTTVTEDRLGVRQSVIGRMERNGGRAAVRSAAGEGTEVQLQMPRRQGDG